MEQITAPNLLPSYPHEHANSGQQEERRRDELFENMINCSRPAIFSPRTPVVGSNISLLIKTLEENVCSENQLPNPSPPSVKVLVGGCEQAHSMGLTACAL